MNKSENPTSDPASAKNLNTGIHPDDDSTDEQFPPVQVRNSSSSSITYSVLGGTKFWINYSTRQGTRNNRACRTKARQRDTATPKSLVLLYSLRLDRVCGQFFLEDPNETGLLAQVYSCRVQLTAHPNPTDNPVTSYSLTSDFFTLLQSLSFLFLSSFFFFLTIFLLFFYINITN